MNEADRTEFDGRPYFCLVCHVGFADFLKCPKAICEMEPRGAALMRAETHAAHRAIEAEKIRNEARAKEQAAHKAWLDAQAKKLTI